MATDHCRRLAGMSGLIDFESDCLREKHSYLLYGVKYKYIYFPLSENNQWTNLFYFCYIHFYKIFNQLYVKLGEIKLLQVTWSGATTIELF